MNGLPEGYKFSKKTGMIVGGSSDGKTVYYLRRFNPSVTCCIVSDGKPTEEQVQAAIKQIEAHNG